MVSETQSQLYRLILHQHQQRWAKAIRAGEEVKYPHQSQPLTPDLVEAHLAGKITLGAMLLQQGTNTAKAGCIDIDVPRDAPNLLEALALASKIQKAASDRHLHAYIEFSGNRGFHLWLFSASPLPGKTWIAALKNLAAGADFTPTEVFPGHELREYKCIKLPGGVHLKSGRRCGYFADDPQWDDRGFPLLPEQAGLMATFKQNPPSAIATLAEFPRSDRRSGGKTEKFSSFNSNQHPDCIQHLIGNGAPISLDYNAVNLTLARYAIERGMSESAALELAKAVAGATPENHPTSKDEKGKVSNFKSAFRSASRNNYSWDCAYALAGIDTHNPEALKSRGCIGEACPMWAYHHKPFTKNKSTPVPLNAAIWEAINHLASTGAEIRISTVIAAVEKLPLSDFKAPWQATAADELAEKEALAYILQHPESLTRVLALDILCQGFISTTAEPPADYLSGLMKADIPRQHNTFIAHLERIRDTGIRVLAYQKASITLAQYPDRTAPIADSLDGLITESQNLLRRTSNEIQPMEAYSQELIEDLFSKPQSAIASPSKWLNNALNGGFAPGKLYVMGAPPGAGKTSFCNWCGDYAAVNGIPVLVAAYEMSRHQLWTYSLSRRAGINSALIESKRWNDESYEARDTLLERVLRAAEDYKHQIAPNITILECGAEHTAARLKGAIAQVRQNASKDESAPVLVVVDYLQLMLSGDEWLDNSAAETLRVSRIATALKQLARDTQAAVIAISDITKAAYQQALSTGSLDLSALRDSFKIAHAADAILLLQTGKITVGKGNNAQQLDQLALAAKKYPPEKQRLVEQVRINHPLNEASRDTYARLSILKNRGGGLAEPLFVYQKALHRFQPIDLQLGGYNSDEDSI